LNEPCGAAAAQTTPKGLALISELEFKSLAQQGYNRIPLMVEAFADLETPLSLYLKLAFSKDGGKYSFLLEWGWSENSPAVHLLLI
jgi:hypothetical protein